MSSTIVVTRRYVCSSLCSLHKGETCCFQVQWVFRCKNQISSNQWVLFLEPFSSQWKSHVGVQDFSANPPEWFASAGGGGRKCSVNWPWKFSLAYAFGAPNVLVLFLLEKNVFLGGEQLKTQKANLKILLHENIFFFVPLFLIFFGQWIFVIRFFLNSNFLAFFFWRQCIQEFCQFCWCGKNTEVVAIVVCIVTEFSQEGISCHDRWGCPTKQWGSGGWWMGWITVHGKIGFYNRVHPKMKRGNSCNA